MLPPLWQGVGFVIAGVVVALSTPKTVRSQSQAKDHLLEKQVKVFGMEQSAFIKALDSPHYARWRRFSTWFTMLLFAAVLIFIGIGTLTGLFSVK